MSFLDGTYVIDFGAGPEPVLQGPLPTGAVRDLRAEKDFLYVNGLDGSMTLYAQHGGVWSGGGEHDVWDWVDGVVEEGRYTVRRRPGELLVGTSQSVGP